MIASVVVFLFVSNRADDQSATDTDRNSNITTNNNTSQINDSDTISGKTGRSSNNCCGDRANAYESSSNSTTGTGERHNRNSTCGGCSRSRGDGTNTRSSTRGSRNDSRLEG